LRFCGAGEASALPRGAGCREWFGNLSTTMEKIVMIGGAIMIEITMIILIIIIIIMIIVETPFYNAHLVCVAIDDRRPYCAREERMRERERERERERQRETERDRERQRETERQRDREMRGGRILVVFAVIVTAIIDTPHPDRGHQIASSSRPSSLLYIIIILVITSHRHPRIAALLRSFHHVVIVFIIAAITLHSLGRPPDRGSDEDRDDNDRRRIHGFSDCTADDLMPFIPVLLMVTPTLLMVTHRHC
jgi:hypothetical protein